MKTLRDVLADELTRRALMGHTPLTVAVIRRRVDGFLRWLECEADADPVVVPGHLRPEHIEKWLIWTRRRYIRNGLTLRPQSIVTIVSSVRWFVCSMAHARLVSQDVAGAFGHISKPKILPKPTPAHRHIKRMFDRFEPTNFRGHTMRAIVEVLYSTGMRPCELLAMDTDSFDREAELVRVMGKGKRERMLPVGRKAVRLLESYLRGVRPALLRDPAERALWLNSRGTRMGYDTLSKGMVACFPECGSLRFTAYSLRRACATELIRANASIWAVKELLGHQSLDELEHYVQLTINDLQKVHARCHPRDSAPNICP